MFGKKYEQNFHVHDNANSFSTGHLISHDRATSALDKRGLMLHIREATVKRNGRMEIIASLVLKGNKISGQRFKFLTDTFPARRGETFVIDGTWGKNELPPL